MYLARCRPVMRESTLGSYQRSFPGPIVTQGTGSRSSRAQIETNRCRNLHLKVVQVPTVVHIVYTSVRMVNY
jgi:hypothetical protein